MPTNSRPDPGRAASLWFGSFRPTATCYIVHAGYRYDDGDESMHAGLRRRHVLRDADRPIRPRCAGSRKGDGRTRATPTRANPNTDGWTRATATRASRCVDGWAWATATRASPNADGWAWAAAEQSGSSRRTVNIWQQHNCDVDTANGRASAVQSSGGAATNRPLQSAQCLQSHASRAVQAGQCLQPDASDAVQVE
jgi:hypothetical protein